MGNHRYQDNSWLAFLPSKSTLPLSAATSKANISSNTGEPIYHVPGQEYYWETRIDLLKGERWLCSEEAARKLDGGSLGSEPSLANSESRRFMTARRAASRCHRVSRRNCGA